MPEIGETERLAWIAGDEAQSLPSRHQAFAQLHDTIVEVARSVARKWGYSSGDREVFVADSLGVAWDKLPKFPRNGGAPLQAWLHAVLRNDNFSKHRTSKRRAHLWRQMPQTDPQEAMQIEPIDSSNSFAEFLWQLDADTPFSGAALELIAAQSPINRLVVLLSVGLWKKVPVNIWETWVTEQLIPLPFPPHEFFSLHEPDQRIEWLSDTFGVRRNSIVQHLSRARKSWLLPLANRLGLNP